MAVKSDSELLRETHGTVLTLAVRFEAVEKKVDQHDRELYGNSRWGLKACMRLVLAVGAFLAVISGTVTAAG